MSTDKKAPYIRVGFSTWYWGPNTDAAEQLLKDNLRADMDTWNDWLTIEVVEDVDGEVGHISDWVWDALDVACPLVDDEGHGESCKICRGEEAYTPDWKRPEYESGWPDYRDTAGEQGWNDDTMLLHALAFISKEGITHKFERYCKQCADEENAEMEAVHQEER